MVVTIPRNRARVLHRARRLAPAAAARAGPWLVLAPHPDDEVLGTGGLIAALNAAGGTVVVAFLTDGSGSHTGAPGWSAARIAAARRQEAGAALRTLGQAAPPTMLGWCDAAPFAHGSRSWARTARRLTALCRRHGVRRIVTSWAGDPHCDHVAAAALARSVARQVGARLAFCAVWGWTVADDGGGARGARSRLRATAVPVARWRGAGRRALACHRTQAGGRIFGAADRFVLPRPLRRLADAPFALLLEDRDAA